MPSDRLTSLSRLSPPSPPAAPTMALSSSSGPSAEDDSLLDTSPLSDVAKRGLVDALYSVRKLCSSAARPRD